MAKKKLKRARRPRNVTANIPHKDPKLSAPIKNTSTHKVRAAWFNAREAWPQREAPVDRLMKARAVATSSMAVEPSMSDWEQVGPTNIGGRMTSVIIHPSDPEKIWAGAAGGGIWTSDDGGLNWQALWHNEPTLNIGSLAIDNSQPHTLYCGTGEANLSADSHAGVGVYRSLDSGNSWHLLASSSHQQIPSRIGRIAVDPFNSQHLLLGGVSHQLTQQPSGLYQSLDGGINWAKVNGITNGPNRCHEIVFHPQSPGIVYATIDAIGMQNGIWKSEDGGQSWRQLLNGLPHPPHMGRTSLAIAASNPAVVYALCADNDRNVFGKVLGIFRSNNGGHTWQDIHGNHFAQERQMNYNSTISVDPADEDTVICAGVDLHRTTNAGNTWSKVTDWRANRGDSNYAHADHHAVLHAQGQVGLIYDMNDGGMDVSLDGGLNWQNRSNGLATNMFYDLSVAASDVNMYGGGLQDNGTVLTLNGQADDFFMATGGDGGFCAIDPNDNLHLFTSSQFMRINRFRSTDGWKVDIGPLEMGSRPWMAFIAMDPEQPKRIFIGSKRVWRSTTDGTPSSWRDVSGILDDSFITCIEISRADTSRIYVGTENGGIFASQDGGTTWSGNIASSTLPGRTITRLRTPANNADIVYATVANFDNSHLFRSLDGGAIWDDVDQGNLPNVPHHSIAISDSAPDTIYVANDAGVFISTDAAFSWRNLSGNLPTVMVVDLVLHNDSRKLFAATYGRSTWALEL